MSNGVGCQSCGWTGSLYERTPLPRSVEENICSTCGGELTAQDIPMHVDNVLAEQCAEKRGVAPIVPVETLMFTVAVHVPATIDLDHVVDDNDPDVRSFSDQLALHVGAALDGLYDTEGRSGRLGYVTLADQLPYRLS